MGIIRGVNRWRSNVSAVAKTGPLTPLVYNRRVLSEHGGGVVRLRHHPGLADPHPCRMADFLRRVLTKDSNGQLMKIEHINVALFYVVIMKLNVRTTSPYMECTNQDAGTMS